MNEHMEHQFRKLRDAVAVLYLEYGYDSPELKDLVDRAIEDAGGD